MQETEAPEDTPAGLASGRYRSRYAMIATAIVTALTVMMTCRGEQSRYRKRIRTASFLLYPPVLPGGLEGLTPLQTFHRCTPTAGWGSSTGP